MNALTYGAVTANNESTPLPDKLVPLGYRITAADIGAGVVFLASSRERFITGISLKVDGGLDLVSGSSLRSRRLLQLFLIQSHFNLEDILLYVVGSSSCQVVRLFDISVFSAIYEVYTTC